SQDGAGHEQGRHAAVRELHRLLPKRRPLVSAARTDRRIRRGPLPQGMTLAQAMTLVPIKLRVLHLSDIHFREAAGIDARLRMIQRETPRRARVMAGDAWRRNLSELLDDGPIDLVCIT